MAALSYDDTKRLIDLVLSRPMESARLDLARELEKIDGNAGQFYEGIVEHGQGMRLTTDQWFDLLSKLPNRILRSDLNLGGLLSQEQIKRLPPVSG